MSVIDAQEIRARAAELSAAPPEFILKWAVDRYRPRVGLTCTFSGGGVVLAHMLAGIALETPVIFIDTSFHFPETLEFKQEFVRRYGINLVEYQPSLSLTEQNERHGEALYARDPDLCCALRKVEPMQRALASLDAWISALRRDQAETRRHTEVLEVHLTSEGRPVVKVHPLARWTRRDVWRYIDEHGIPSHPLLDQGYASIGCWPCTRPVEPGQPERAGRWAGTGKTECGLHTFTQRA